MESGDLSPEGHQPKASTRIFPGVQQPICIGVLARDGKPDPATPASIRYAQVNGDRARKLAGLRALATSAYDPAGSHDGRAAPAPDGET